MTSGRPERARANGRCYLLEMPPASLRMGLLGCVELDPRTVQLNVCERWTEQRWFRSREHQQQRVYTMSIGVGRWHDGQNFVLQGDPRHFRLMELWQGHQHEQKLDALVFEPEPVKYVLPPVPVPQRR